MSTTVAYSPRSKRRFLRWSLRSLLIFTTILAIACGYVVRERKRNQQSAEACYKTGCVMGAVPPFSLNPELNIVVDEDLLANATLFFNAGRLDRSMELDTQDWLAVARPRVARIAASA